MEEKILSILKEMQSDIKSLNNRFDNLENRFDVLGNQVNENTHLLRALEHKVDVIKAEQDKLTFTVAEASKNSHIAKMMAFDALNDTSRIKMMNYMMDI